MLKIGIVGCGRISAVHIWGIEQAGGTGKIVAVCDIDEDKLNATGDKLGIPQEYRFTNYMDLINCPEVEAVEVCTPNHLHVPIALEAAKAGKPVEIEKPLTTTYKDGVEELIKVIEEKNLPNMMCFSYRFMPAVRYAKHLLENGALGQIVNVNIEYLQSGVLIPGRRLEWRFVKEYAGTGTLGDLGVHLIDMTRFLVGEFKSVFAMQNTIVKERQKLDSDEFAPVEVDDITSFIASLENNVIANFLVTKCAVGESNTIKYEIYGTKGVIKFNLNKPGELTVCSPATGGVPTVEKVAKEFFLGQEECFIDAASGTKVHPHYPDVREGGKSQIIVDAIQQSATEKRVVEL